MPPYTIPLYLEGMQPGLEPQAVLLRRVGGGVVGVGEEEGQVPPELQDVLLQGGRSFNMLELTTTLPTCNANPCPRIFALLIR